MQNITLPAGSKFILERLAQKGFEGFAVGGFLRDALLGRISHDCDIATNALPEQILDVFHDMRTIPTGLSHGTVTVLIDGVSFEVTTYRIDGEYSDSRHPDRVLFTDDITADLARRDFTMNAIAYSPEKGIIDPFGGQDDIKARRIVTVGYADIRFGEDALRILRALRFASVLGFEVEKNTSDSIHKNAPLLDSISRERIYSEFTKLLCGKNVGNVLLDYSDVISIIIPEIAPCIGFEQKIKYHYCDVYTHIAKSLEASAPEKNIRLALFLHDIGKPKCHTMIDGVGHFYGHARESKKIGEKVLKDLRADNETIKKVSRLVELHDVEILPTKKAVKRILAKIGTDGLEQLLEIQACDAIAHAAPYRDKNAYLTKIKKIAQEITRDEECFSLKQLAVNGNDLAALGIKQGPLVGEILAALLERVMCEELPNEKEALLNWISENKL